jgi:ABC-type multidrug transport system ATPase subunit
VLAGRLAPEEGTVRVLGRAARGAAKQIGYAPEEARPVALFTPHQMLLQRMIRYDVPGAQRPARIAEALEIFDLYADRDRPIRELSRTQQTALTLAAALAHRPALLLLDNLLPAPPSPLAERLRAYLEARCADDGLTVLHATNRNDEAEQADRVLLLDAGCPRAFASPAELLAQHAADILMVEAADPDAVQRTLRGIFDVAITPTRDGLRFSAADGLAVAAHLFRHPSGGVRVVTLRPPTLWDVLERLRGDRRSGA